MGSTSATTQIVLGVSGAILVFTLVRIWATRGMGSDRRRRATAVRSPWPDDTARPWLYAVEMARGRLRAGASSRCRTPAEPASADTGASPYVDPSTSAANASRPDRARLSSPITAPLIQPDPMPALPPRSPGRDAPRLTVRVLGCPALCDVDGGGVSGLRESALELLVYLVVHRDGATLDSITQDVYGATTRQRAVERLSTDVANLRNRIRHALDVGREVNPVVKARERYRLDPALLEVDWWQVQDACRRVSAARTDLAAQVVALRRASALCGGVLADGAAYDWLSGVQERSRRVGVGIRTRLADLLEPSDPAEAAGILARACELDPFDEDLAARAIRAHLRLGDHDAAQVQFEVLRQALADLGETPDRVTAALVGRAGSSG